MELYESNLGGGQFICRETCWCIWLGKIFCSQKKNGNSYYIMAPPSLFFPYFDFALMNVYGNTGIK